jgi:hypothetical protein
MAGFSHHEARMRGARIVRAADMERVQARLRYGGGPDTGPSRGATTTTLLAVLVLALLGFILFVRDGEGGLALVKAFTSLFG